MLTSLLLWVFKNYPKVKITHTDNPLIIFLPGSENAQTASWKKSFTHIKTQYIENSEENRCVYIYIFLKAHNLDKDFFNVFMWEKPKQNYFTNNY